MPLFPALGHALLEALLRYKDAGLSYPLPLASSRCGGLTLTRARTTDQQQHGALTLAVAHPFTQQARRRPHALPPPRLMPRNPSARHRLPRRPWAARCARGPRDCQHRVLQSVSSAQAMQRSLGLLILVVTSALAIALPHKLAGRATTWATGAPLTLSFSLDPSPTESGAAVASAYGVFQKSCGAALEQVVQDTLARYGNFHNLDALPAPNDNDFITFAEEFPEYRNAKSLCDDAQLGLDNAEDAATHTATSTPKTPPATSGIPAKSASGSTRSTAPSPTSSIPNGAAPHRPGGLMLLASMAFIFVL
ncbi:hypothetical protein B0H15DRAFT_949836 [Mycena belliarum]|uniref:Uncharacterized protein n=1 Tax=Mycena belliarum TaxID=1033014 RepID=A0AAD6U4Y5_9AGAR|nr:hypothetical protein B0H15DRAFT_949836 [Mycena belliae]